MVDVNETVDLSPNRVAGLSETAQRLFIGRCALRVLPALIPPDTGDPKRRAALMVAANTCCFAALRAAVETEDFDRDPVMRAVTALEGSTVDTSAARTCVIAAGQSAAAQSPSATSQAVLAGLAAYRNTAIEHAMGEHDVGEVVLSGIEAGDDLEKLERREHTASIDREFALEFLSRPLFAPSTGVPPAWRPRVNEWALYLTALELDGIAAQYAAMCQGTAVTVEDLVRFTADPEPAAPPPPPSPDTARPPDVWMLADRPLTDRFEEQDKFQFKDYADALAAVLDHEKTDTPFTMPINAPWGAGKTTLAHMIADRLRQRPKDRGEAPHIICWFNAWMHDDAPNLATAFISEIGRIADRHRRVLPRLLYPLPSAVLSAAARRRRRLALGGIVLTATVLATAWFVDHLAHVDERRSFEAARREAFQATETTLRDAANTVTGRSESLTFPRSRPADRPPAEPGAPDGPDEFLVWLQGRVVLLGTFFTALAGLAGVAGLLTKLVTSTSLAGFIESPGLAAETGAIQSAQEQVGRLIRQATWRGNRFVVFVDDIERCRQARSIDVLDAVNQLMDHRGVVVVLLGDMSSVAAAAQLKYKDLAEIFAPSAGVTVTGPARSREAFGRMYLEKIVQFQFDLPIPPRSRIQDYMGQLAIPQPDGGARG